MKSPDIVINKTLLCEGISILSSLDALRGLNAYLNYSVVMWWLSFPAEHFQEPLAEYSVSEQYLQSVPFFLVAHFSLPSEDRYFKSHFWFIVGEH